MSSFTSRMAEYDSALCRLFQDFEPRSAPEAIRWALDVARDGRASTLERWVEGLADASLVACTREARLLHAAERKHRACALYVEACGQAAEGLVAYARKDHHAARALLRALSREAERRMTLYALTVRQLRGALKE